jgi:tripartite-type tricarboxylate transporter receptor subunit TctC
MQAAKARSLNAGSAGNGSGPHLALELFNDLTGSTITHVPYRGGAPALNELIAGRLDVNFANYPQALPHIKSGKLHLVAICSTTRHPDFPNVPTARESGVPELVMENWTGVMAPAATPDSVVERLSSELVKIVSQPEMAEGLLQRGFRVNAKGRAEFAVFLKSEVDRWGRLIKKAKITVD